MPPSSSSLSSSLFPRFLPLSRGGTGPVFLAANLSITVTRNQDQG